MSVNGKPLIGITQEEFVFKFENNTLYLRIMFQITVTIINYIGRHNEWAVLERM